MPHEDYCYALERENHALNEKYESLRQQLLDTKSVLDQAMTTVDDLQKSNVMLRDALEYHQAQTRPIQRTEEALAATDDLDGLILCEKKPVAYMAVDSQGGSLFFRNEVLTIKTIPLYIALDQK